MSKLSILSELANLRALSQRKSLLTRGAVIGLLAYVFVGYGHDLGSYLSTSFRLVKDKVRTNVPVEFELERARTMINDLIPDLRQNMVVIAQEEVNVENLRAELERGESELKKQHEDLIRLRTDMENRSGILRLGNRPASSDEVREELTRRFNRYQVAEATVSAKRQLLAAREKSLSAVRVRLDNMLNSKRDLELQVENLVARLKTQQSHVASSAVEVNDTHVAHCKTLVDELRVRLEVADRLLANSGDIADLVIPSSLPSEDIGEQIDRYFTKSSKDLALADGRK